MKCIVTGATGHIGNILVRRLHERGHEVTAFVLPREDITSIKAWADHVVYGDIRDTQSLEYAFTGQDTVFHLAGIVDIGSSHKTKRLMYEVNVQGVRNVVDACRTTKVKRLVYTSSVHALTELPHGQTITESQVFNPLLVKGMYAKTKAEATAYVLQATREGLDAVIVHPSGVIGPEDHQMSNLGQMVLDFLKGTLRAYVSGGYNFVDVRDVVEGMMDAAEKGKSGECYILSGEYHSVHELLHTMEEITAIKAPRTRIPHVLACISAPFAELYYRMLRQKPLFTAYSIFTLNTNSDFSHAKAQRVLDYSVTPFRKTMEDTIAWIRLHKLNGKEKSPLKPLNQHRLKPEGSALLMLV